jgi:hydrogenase expression/formation protein HypC
MPGRRPDVCLELPGRIVELEAGVATVDTEGRRVRASTLVVPDAAVGDWVVVVAGMIVDRLSPAQAGEIRATLRGAIADERAGVAIPAPKGGA